MTSNEEGYQIGLY